MAATASQLSAITTIDENLTDGGITVAAGPTYNITSDLTLGPGAANDADTEYVLNGTTFVNAGATLTIEAGVVIYGQPRDVSNAPGTLVVSRGAEIFAQGSVANPIIFTSAQTAGGARATAPAYADIADSDPRTSPVAPTTNGWGSVILLGYAPTNAGTNDTGIAGEAYIEGLGFANESVTYGGNLPNDSSGTLSFVSIRNSGDTPILNEELQGLTLGGVGMGTQIDHIEISGSGDDGIEIFGGTVNMSHILISYFDDDGLDVDQGWTGLAQFIFILTSGATGITSDHLLELDGDDSGTDAGNNFNFLAVPVSHPTIYNLTAMGAKDGDGNDETEQDRMILMRHGFGGQINNSIFIHAQCDSTAFTIDNSAAGANVDRVLEGFFDNLPEAQVDLGYLGLAGTLWWDVTNAAGTGTAITDIATAGGAQDILNNSANAPSASGNVVGSNPLFGLFAGNTANYFRQNVANSLNPVGSPGVLGSSFAGLVPVTSTFFENVSYIGAFAPSPATLLWTSGWTALNVRGILVDNGAGIDVI